MFHNVYHKHKQSLYNKSHKKKTAPGQLHLSIGGSSRFQNLAQNQNFAQKTTGTWLVEVVPLTESEFYLNQAQAQKLIILHGAGGNYAELPADQTYLKSHAKSIGATIIDADDNLVRAHLASKKLRKNCGITTEVGTAMLASMSWNNAEELLPLECKEISYSPDMQNVPVEEIFLDQHKRVRVAMVETFEERAKLMSGTQLLLHEQTIVGHEENS